MDGRATAPEGDYHPAAVCRRGHVETEYADFRDGPLPEHCLHCGAPMMTKCTSCGAPIRGAPRGLGIPPAYRPAPFCACGEPHPWATDEAIVYHIENKLDDDELSPADRRELEKQLKVLTEEGAAAKRKAEALSTLRRMAPRVWETAQPAIKVLLTTEVTQHLR
jgi:hypothetical protein